VIAVVITLAGLIAIRSIPIAQFPDIVPPQVSLTANYPGADPEVIENTVAQPIEQQIEEPPAKATAIRRPSPPRIGSHWAA
jgi:hydrophobic/amphiphilic exporter-1 (mainly G- bacteria), HAE1 family